TARNDLAVFLAAPSRNAAWVLLHLQSVEGCPDDVVGIRGAERFCDHVLHAQHLEHRAHGAAGDDAGARRRRPQDYPAGSMAACAVVMKRAAFEQRTAHQTAPRRFVGLADRLGHLACLTMPEADAALVVTDDDERGETEALTALHHLRDAVDVHQ